MGGGGVLENGFDGWVSVHRLGASVAVKVVECTKEFVCFGASADLAVAVGVVATGGFFDGGGKGGFLLQVVETQFFVAKMILECVFGDLV